MAVPQDLLCPFARLNRERKAEGRSPLELQRWIDPRRRLEHAFSGHAPPMGARFDAPDSTLRQIAEELVREH